MASNKTKVVRVFEDDLKLLVRIQKLESTAYTFRPPQSQAPAYTISSALRAYERFLKGELLPKE